ncbi:MAG: hypothetical protein KME45_21795 [Stenomitos rutilans HA7619-LM2]|nr:hypothetical protein [Stenomitos rutilans HA7619-LM2]
MHSGWSRVLRSTYQRDPAISFVLTAGVVEAAIGGLNEHWSLLTFGLGTAGVAITLRFWQQRRQVAKWTERAPVYTLSAADARPRLPELKPKRKLASGKR